MINNMSEYLIRQDDKNTFTVSKWDDGEVPTIIYTVKRHSRGFGCNCWGYLRNYSECKHIKMVKDFEPNYDEMFSRLKQLITELGVK